MRQGTRQGPRIAAKDRRKELNQEMKHITRRGQGRKVKERQGKARRGKEPGIQARNEVKELKQPKQGTRQGTRQGPD